MWAEGKVDMTKCQGCKACEVLGHKKTIKIETKQREDMISIVLAQYQRNDKELCGAQRSSL